MPMRRRRVYLDYSSSRKARMEGWLSLSIFLSAAILVLSLIGCLPDVASSIIKWLVPEKVSLRLGVTAGAETPMLVELCEIVMALSGICLAAALVLKSLTRQRTQ